MAQCCSSDGGLEAERTSGSLEGRYNLLGPVYSDGLFPPGPNSKSPGKPYNTIVGGEVHTAALLKQAANWD